jgi:hypothetical protein
MSDPFRTKLHEHLDGLFERHHVVVWWDASGALGRVLREPGVLPSGVTMPEFKGNPLSLRAPLDAGDPWIERKWLLYVPPLPEGFTCEWLADYEQGFACVRGGTLSWCLDVFFGLRETAELRAALVGPAAEELAMHFAEYFSGAKGPLREGEVLRALLQAAVRAPKADWPELLLRYVTSASDRAAWDAARLSATLTAAIRDHLGLRRHVTPGQAPDIGALCRCMVASALVESEAVEGKPLANHLTDKEYRETWVLALRQGLHDPERRPQLETAIEQGRGGPALPGQGPLLRPRRLPGGRLRSPGRGVRRAARRRLEARRGVQEAPAGRGAARARVGSGARPPCAA